MVWRLFQLKLDSYPTHFFKTKCNFNNNNNKKRMITSYGEFFGKLILMRLNDKF